MKHYTYIILIIFFHNYSISYYHHHHHHLYYMKRKHSHREIIEEEEDRERKKINKTPTMGKEDIYSFEKTIDIWIDNFQYTSRYNPEMLLQLVQTNPYIYNLINQKNGFWYYICKYSFPHISVHGYTQYTEEKIIGGLKYPTGKYHKMSSRLFGERLFLTIHNQNISLPSSLDYADSLIFNYLDRSFIDGDLLWECRQNRETAKATARYFKAIYPLGIPPAEYCFESQIMLRRYMKRFISILLGGDKNRYIIRINDIMDIIVQNHTIVSYNMTRYNPIYLFPFMSIIDVKPVVDGIYEFISFKGRGPFSSSDLQEVLVQRGRERVTNRNTFTHVFELKDLLKIIKESKKFIVWEGDEIQINKLINEIEQSIQIYDKEDANDPLFYNKLQQNEVFIGNTVHGEFFTNNQWLKAIKKQIKFEKIYKNQGLIRPIELSASISSSDSSNSLINYFSCKNCSKQTFLMDEKSNLFFCSEKCQKYHYCRTRTCNLPITHPTVCTTLNIKKATIQNNDYRNVIHTTTHMQIVLMSIQPRGIIEKEIHKNVTQFIKIEKGRALIEIFNHDGNKKEHSHTLDSITGSDTFIIQPNTYHKVTNISHGEQFLKLYTIYSGKVH